MLPGYPKVMRHSAFVKGIAQEVPPKNYKGDKKDWFPGTSDRFPEVTVTNPDQQAWHESRGYEAIDGSHVVNFPPEHGYQEYPKWIKNQDGEEVLVESVEHESQVMGHNEPGKLGSPARQNQPKNIPENIPDPPKVRKKPGPPKGYKRKPKTDHMQVTD